MRLQSQLQGSLHLVRWLQDIHRLFLLLLHIRPPHEQHPVRVTGNAKKFAKDAKILQFDVDAAEMNKNILITEGVVGDLKVVLQKMNERLEQQNHKEWIEKIISYKEKYPMTYHPDVLSGPFIVEEIYRQTNGEAIIST